MRHSSIENILDDIPACRCRRPRLSELRGKMHEQRDDLNVLKRLVVHFEASTISDLHVWHQVNDTSLLMSREGPRAR